MQSLPTRIANLTLMRRLGANALAESFLGVLDDPPGRMVSVRRLHPWVVQSPDLMRQIETRLLDLSSGSHPSLVNILEYVDSGDERLVVEEWMESVSLAEVISWCQRQEQVIPHAILLDLGVRVCDALDALHARVGRESRDEHVLHQGLRPSAVRVTREGRLVVGGYGLVRSENALPQPPPEAEIAPTSGYLTPEQTWPDRDLSPATDLFALGTLLFEMSTLKPLFDGSNPLATIKLVRNAEVDISLIEARSAFPGLEKVLYRALTENPKHRYQRAFVLREDLRGLMAGYDFTHIQRDLLDFLTPIFLEHAAAAQEDASRNLEETTANLLGDPMGMPVRDLGERLDPLAGLDLPDRPDTLIPDDPSRWEDAFAPLDVGMLGGDYDTAETGETIPPLPLDRPIPPPPAAPSPLFPEPSHRGPSPSTFSFERQDEPARQVVAIPHDEPARQVVAIPHDEPARQVVAIP
ncbi:MAG: protein kinase, partial [Deltaproteobacteria bacterium]|nr:protein kinase [Deltaproteobacteria bacterium]